jgi:hypothetical protein
MASSISSPQRKLSISSGFNYAVGGLLVLVLAVRLSFLGTGAMTFPDEYRYYSSYDAIYGLFPLSHGGLDKFNAAIAQTQGRPGDALLRVMPASLQLLAYRATGLDPHSPTSLLIPVVFNYLITCCALLLFYRIARLLLRNQPAALLSTLVYACLVNTNLYIRHILPYDTGMLCTLATFYWVLRLKQRPERRTKRAMFGIGALAGLTFTVYPGYNAIIIVAWLLLLEKQAVLSFQWKRLLLTSMLYGLGVAAVLLFFQVLSIANGTSYYEDCLGLSGSIRQGDFSDGFAFLPKYLFEAEQSLGYVLAGLGLLAVPVLLFRVLRGRLTAGRLFGLLSDNTLVIGMVLAFLWYAVMVYFLEKMVFYGRILHLYFPFFVLLIARVLYPAVRRNIQYVPAALVAGVALYSFAIFTIQYHRLVYPVTFLHQHGPEFRGTEALLKDQSASADNGDYHAARYAFMQGPPVPGQPKIALVNMSFLYPIRDAGWCNQVTLPPSFKLVYTGPHFLTLPAYPFEGYRIDEREVIYRCQYQCQVYKEKK